MIIAVAGINQPAPGGIDNSWYFVFQKHLQYGFGLFLWITVGHASKGDEEDFMVEGKQL
jgi:hypothetical protein